MTAYLKLEDAVTGQAIGPSVPTLVPQASASIVSIQTGIRRHPRYWGVWFRKIGDSAVLETNLNLFFQFGAAIQSVSEHIGTGKPVPEVAIYIPMAQQWLDGFLHQTTTLPLKDSREAARKLRDLLAGIYESMRGGERPISYEECSGFFFLKEELEQAFEREHRNLSVFTVTPKGIYDTRLLIENTEEKFPQVVLAYLPPHCIVDLRQAGRCLAFEVPTACAFHVFRATESVIRRYYEVLAKQQWLHSTRDMGSYIRELEKLPGVNLDVIRRMREIKDFERNPSIHPEQIVTKEKAPILFELCSGVIYAMAIEIGNVLQNP